MDAMNKHLQQGMKDAPHMALVHNWQQVVYCKVIGKTIKVLQITSVWFCLCWPGLPLKSKFCLMFLDAMALFINFQQ